MKQKQKNVLTIIGVAIVAYAIGAYLGFPFAQLGLSTGNIGKANKQQENLSSPADVKLVEKFETDTVYRNKMIDGYAMLYVQAKATVTTIRNLRDNIAQTAELKPYAGSMNNIIEVGDQLLPMLENGISGLDNLKNGKSASDLSSQLSQALNLFQIMNTNLASLDSFTSKAGELSKQKKLNDDLLKLYQEFLVESADVAMSCGDNARVSKSLGWIKKITPTTNFKEVGALVNNSYVSVAAGFKPLKKTELHKVDIVVFEHAVNKMGQISSGNQIQNMSPLEPLLPK